MHDAFLKGPPAPLGFPACRGFEHTTQLHLRNIDRGEHSLAVQVLAQDGVSQQSSTLRFTVQRVSKH